MILGKKLYGLIAGATIVGGGTGAYIYFSKGSETTPDSVQTLGTLKDLKSFKGMSDEQISNTKKFFEDLKQKPTDKSFLSSL